ncbi:STAS domain-containing protein [Streptomyces sp. CA-142005]|uniref:STAS domain-containing protein n=1 Tax=Streptomyces sp. CA-142005 TaxID=3240052 RepID=UPI003D8BFD24
MTEIKGALDTTTARELCDYEAAVTAEHRPLLNLIVDLSELTWADTGGLAALMSVRAMLEEDEGELRLTCPEGGVERTPARQRTRPPRPCPSTPSLEAALTAPRTTVANRMGGAVQ